MKYITLSSILGLAFALKSERTVPFSPNERGERVTTNINVMSNTYTIECSELCKCEMVPPKGEPVYCNVPRESKASLFANHCKVAVWFSLEGHVTACMAEYHEVKYKSPKLGPGGRGRIVDDGHHDLSESRTPPPSYDSLFGTKTPTAPRKPRGSPFKSSSDLPEHLGEPLTTSTVDATVGSFSSPSSTESSDGETDRATVGTFSSMTESLTDSGTTVPTTEMLTDSSEDRRSTDSSIHANSPPILSPESGMRVNTGLPPIYRPPIDLSAISESSSENPKKLKRTKRFSRSNLLAKPSIESPRDNEHV